VQHIGTTAGATNLPRRSGHDGSLVTDQPIPRLVRPRDLLAEALELAEQRHRAYSTDTALGPRITLSPKLDRELCGHVPNGVTILLGAPGSAKTAFANQLAAQAECPALVVTIEMSPITLLHRHTARVTKTHAAKFRTGEIAPDLCRELFTRTIETMPSLAFLDGTCAPVTVDDILDAALKTKGSEEHLLIVLDSLHSWVRGSGMIAGGASEYTATSAAVSALQRIGAERECSVLVVSEQNRSNMGTDRQEAGADSRAIEYGAEVVIALSRERNAIPDEDDEVPITATIAKNRDGSPGTTIDLRFCGRFMAFREGDGTANVVASAAGRGKFTSSAGNHNGKAMVD
jgi:replicative DNA helicase